MLREQSHAGSMFDIGKYAIRPRIDSFLWVSEHRMPVLFHLVMELQFQVRDCQGCELH